jgi:capsular exopolysaccharide synthesis family protein
VGVEEEPVRIGLRAGWIRRRWWVPLLTVVVATVIGGAVAANRPGSYISSMVFVVPSTPGGISPDGAQKTASNYSALLLEDDLIAQAVGRAVNREPADVRRRLTAVNPVNTALVRVTYRGNTRAEALAGVRALQISLTGPPKPVSPAVKTNSVSPIQEARVTAPPGPMTAFVLAAMFGLCAAAVLIIALERSDTRVDDTAVLEEHFPDIPLLGTVAPLGRQGGIPVRDQPFSPAAEGFQSVRVALERLGLGTRFDVVVVMSADKQEGKTTFAANLGIALARQERMVLLVSGDMRRPGLEKLLDVAPSAGLADLLDNGADNPLRTLFSVVPDLWLLPAGLPSGNPAELLEVGKLRQVLKRTAFGNPVVIIDTPPVLHSADAAALADVADGAVLVVRSGRSRLRSVREIVVGLRRDNTPILGIVLVGHRGNRRRIRYGYAVRTPRPVGQPQVLPLETPGRRSGSRGEGPKAAG